MKRILFTLMAFAMFLALISKGTFGYYSDAETASTNTFTAWVAAPITLLEDSFEGTPWDANWDDNGATTWSQKNQARTGSYSAQCTKNTRGNFTSDNLDASGAASITVSFWFKPTSLEAGDMLVQLYNGTSYVTWYDVTAYSTYSNGQWSYFTETITDSQYFVSNFRLRFNGSALADGNDNFLVDDAVVTVIK